MVRAMGGSRRVNTAGTTGATAVAVRRRPAAAADTVPTKRRLTAKQAESPIAELLESSSVSGASASSGQLLISDFLRSRQNHAEQILANVETAEPAGDINEAVGVLCRDEAGAVLYRSMKLPHTVNGSELSKEIWLSTPQPRRDEFLEKWSARIGVPV